MPCFEREGDNNDDDDDYSAQSAKDLLDGWSNTYGSNQRSSSCLDDVPVTPIPGSKDSWKFDLGLLEKSRRAEPTRGVGRTKSAFETRTAIETIPGLSDDDSDDTDGLSFLSQMEEANMAMEAITRRTLPVRSAPSSESSVPRGERRVPKKSISSDGLAPSDFMRKGSGPDRKGSSGLDRKGSSGLDRRGSIALDRKGSSGLDNTSCHSASSNFSLDIDYSDNDSNKKISSADAELLEQRRAARLERMEKVRLRIAREKEEARKRKEEDDRRAKHLEMSEDARRKRAYEWYCRLGMMSKKEMKKRIRVMGQEAKVTEADCDLLPWNFNGTHVNTTKLQKLSAK